MDMDLGAGGDSARRKMDVAGEVTEVVPLEMYDSARAKIAANLRWLFAKAYGIGKLPKFNIFLLSSWLTRIGYTLISAPI